MKVSVPKIQVFMILFRAEEEKKEEEPKRGVTQFDCCAVETDRVKCSYWKKVQLK